MLDFGRYAGWSLAEVAAQDDDYIEWLRRTPAGRAYDAEIGELLARRDAAFEQVRTAPVATKRRRWGRRESGASAAGERGHTF